MAAEHRATSGDSSRQFWPVLRHALSECLLIVMLFVTALASYSAARLARICRLRSPCVLCATLDRLLHGKAWFSEELVCVAHRLEIARLSYCQSHQKLAHPDDLCDRCHRSCVASAGKTSHLKNISVEEKVNSRSRSRHAHHCSCCSVPFKKTRNAYNGRIPNDRLRKEKARRSIYMASAGHSSDDGSNHLPSEGYSKLKLFHDSESEIHISDDDDEEDGNAVLQEVRERAIGISSIDVQMPPLVPSGNGLSVLPSDGTVITNSMKPLNTAYRQSSDSKAGNFAETSDSSIGHGLDEINWSQINANDNNNGMQWKETPEQFLAELPKEKTFLVGIEEVDGALEVDSGSSFEQATKGLAASTNAGTSSSADAHINSNNSTKNVSASRGHIRSPRLSEIISARDTNSKTNEDVKTFLSQLSCSRGFDGPWSETATSHRISTQIDEFRQYDAIGMTFLDRNNSNLDPFDVNAISEDEDDNSLERLKRQNEHDKKKLSILYKELEAERSASAVAASEAMAMINRLQEEKAAMHMEALQYLRMMEEQADHDQEAIEKLNDLLTEREKDVLDLEAELMNRSRFHDEPFDIGKFAPIDGAMACGTLDGSDFIRTTMFDFEDEKAKILESLYRLEETLGMSSTKRLHLGDTNDNLQDPPLRENSELGTSLFTQEHLYGESVSSHHTDENQSVENQKSFASCSYLDDGKLHSMTNVKHEVSLLNNRLKALEADQSFLRQMLSSLNCSSDGVHCVQEITSHLRELRRNITEQRDMAMAAS